MQKSYCRNETQFFDDFEQSELPEVGSCKIYSDGGHHIATYVMPPGKRRERPRKERGVVELAADALYETAVSRGLKERDVVKTISEGIAEKFPEFEQDVDTLDGKNFAEMIVERHRANLRARLKRFKRKAYLNKWNFFLTFTYDDKKHTPETFEKELKKCLQNYVTRNGWYYMGPPEVGTENGRLHYHFLAYIPKSKRTGKLLMPGKISRKRMYNPVTRKYEKLCQNTFFAEKFGRNAFVELDDNAMNLDKVINYLLKYLTKSNNKIVYSRHIPTEIVAEVKAKDVITKMFQKVGQYIRTYKYVLFDDVVTSEDVDGYRYRKFTPSNLCLVT